MNTAHCVPPITEDLVRDHHSVDQQDLPEDQVQTAAPVPVASNEVPPRTKSNEESNEAANDGFIKNGAMPEKVNLSLADVAEIKKFSESKERILHNTKSLNSRPAIDAFADFISIDGQSCLEDISKAFSSLHKRFLQLRQWEEEVIAIDREASSFEVGDMERMRHLAKGENPM